MDTRLFSSEAIQERESFYSNLNDQQRQVFSTLNDSTRMKVMILSSAEKRYVHYENFTMDNMVEDIERLQITRIFYNKILKLKHMYEYDNRQQHARVALDTFLYEYLRINDITHRIFFQNVDVIIDHFDPANYVYDKLHPSIQDIVHSYHPELYDIKPAPGFRSYRLYKKIEIENQKKYLCTIHPFEDLEKDNLTFRKIVNIISSFNTIDEISVCRLIDKKFCEVMSTCRYIRTQTHLFLNIDKNPFSKMIQSTKISSSSSNNQIVKDSCFIKIPEVLNTLILNYLDVFDLLTIKEVSSQWRNSSLKEADRKDEHIKRLFKAIISNRNTGSVDRLRKEFLEKMSSVLFLPLESQFRHVHTQKWKCLTAVLEILKKTNYNINESEEGDKDSLTPLHLAARTNDVALGQLLFECGAKLDYRSLRIATNKELPNLEFIDFLFKKGISPNHWEGNSSLYNKYTKYHSKSREINGIATLSKLLQNLPTESGRMRTEYLRVISIFMKAGVNVQYYEDVNFYNKKPSPILYAQISPGLSGRLIALGMNHETSLKSLCDVSVYHPCNIVSSNLDKINHMNFFTHLKIGVESAPSPADERTFNFSFAEKLIIHLDKLKEIEWNKVFKQLEEMHPIFNPNQNGFLIKDYASNIFSKTAFLKFFQESYFPEWFGKKVGDFGHTFADESNIDLY